MAVYFLRAPDLDRVKIGFSGRVHDRVNEIRYASPVELTLVAVIRDADRHTEAALHRLCEDEMVKGEWFRERGAVTRLLDGDVDGYSPAPPYQAAGVAVTATEKREIRWLASVNETSISSLLRTMTPVEAVREAERKRAQLSASGSDAA